MKIKVKVENGGVIPSYSKEGDAGLDLTAVSLVFDAESGFYEYDTGLSVEIPVGYVGLLYPRSSLSKMNLLLANHVGVIDSNYRGNIKVRFKKINIHVEKIYKVGDRVAQLIISACPKVEFDKVDSLDDTVRGSDGFGSTGN